MAAKGGGRRSGGQQDELVFLALGGLGEIGMNVYLYGIGPADARRWLMVDLGITFPGDMEPGVDVVLPDLRFIEEQGQALAGIVLTHAHEDHIGAVIDLWPRLKAPIYATPFTAGMLRSKLAEFGGKVKLPITEVPMGGRFKVGPFAIELVTMSHSIPEPSALLIETPLGPHLPYRRLEARSGPAGRRAGQRGAHRRHRRGRGRRTGLRFHQCLPRWPLALRDRGRRLDRDHHQGRQAARRGDDVRLQRRARPGRGGRSPCHRPPAGGRRPRHAPRHRRGQGDGLPAAEFPLSRPGPVRLSGARRDAAAVHGQPGRAAGSARPHRRGRASPYRARVSGDLVIFSSRTIPGNEKAVSPYPERSGAAGCDIITGDEKLVHVTGHPRRDELRQIYAWLQPRIVVPMHGEARHLRENARLAREAGVKEVSYPRRRRDRAAGAGPGAIIDEAPVGRLYRDGRLIVPGGDGPGARAAQAVVRRHRHGVAGAVAARRAGRRSRRSPSTACRPRPPTAATWRTWC